MRSFGARVGGEYKLDDVGVDFLFIIEALRCKACTA